MSDDPNEAGPFPPYDETPHEQADAEMPADSYSAAAARTDEPVDPEGCCA